MLIKKVKAEGLAHLSYLVGSDGRAAVIDPRRDCHVYLDIADGEKLRITHILETHRNEDYVTGSRELASMTGAAILHGDNAFGYGQPVREGDTIDLGQAVLKALATPGHTLDSMSYVLYDRSAGPQPVGVFTGDALFVGEVGRTDLFGEERIGQMAPLLFDSLHDKLLSLGEGTIIYPAHGAGSACGGSISDREESTIGLEMAQNKALTIGSREAFVAMKKAEVMEKPYYFARMEEINLAGQPVLGSLPRPPQLSPGEFERLIGAGAAVLDVRAPTSFAGGHIEGSVSIPREVLPSYAGWVLEYGRPIVLVTDGPEEVSEVVRMLIRIGYDDIIGHLGEGMEGWAKRGLPIASFPLVTPTELHGMLGREENILVLDVRTEKEWRAERVERSMHIFAGYLRDRIDEVPRGTRVAVMCSSGLRGSLGAGILQDAGYEVLNILGGTGGWKKAGLPLEK
ncbi:MAG: rhodanese-like domain-containing protein [Methanomassiliicoccus sp.]|nr:rhodanese-like domain-containing protein [Methanomassiliicoccus sp.]